jgi:hypothetical protein
LDDLNAQHPDLEVTARQAEIDVMQSEGPLSSETVAEALDIADRTGAALIRREAAHCGLTT